MDTWHTRIDLIVTPPESLAANSLDSCRGRLLTSLKQAQEYSLLDFPSI